MAQVVDDLIEAANDEYGVGLVSVLRCPAPTWTCLPASWHTSS
jgi:hypothetical protein